MAMRDTKNISAKPPIKAAVLFGSLVLIVFIGGFCFWSAVAPLESATIATGKITVSSNHKVIQHLEGGIIKKIYIKEGEVVQKDQLLVELDHTQAQAKLALLQSEALELLALEARLKAERDNAPKITWSQRILKNKNNPNVKKIARSQKRIFQANKKTFEGQLEILQQRIKQLDKEIDGLKAQVKSGNKQLKLIQEEITAVKYLEKKKLIEKPRLLALQREAARLIGNRGENLGLIAKAQQKIGETQQQIITIKDKTRKEILSELRGTQAKLTDILEREKAAQDILDRTYIKAPQAGTVVGLAHHTLGGVIGPGKQILDIVPSKDDLVVEARIKPIDIDNIHPGLQARIRLTAFKQRHTPNLIGTVHYVSADSFVDDKTQQTYYKARITINPKELNRIKNISLYPGMPVQVMIITEKRTLLDYFIQPIEDSFTRAFREE